MVRRLLRNEADHYCRRRHAFIQARIMCENCSLRASINRTLSTSTSFSCVRSLVKPIYKARGSSARDAVGASETRNPQGRLLYFGFALCRIKLSPAGCALLALLVIDAAAMIFTLSCILLSVSTALLVEAEPAGVANPVVELSYGSFVGSSSGDLTSFLGMPFAAPPFVKPVLFVSNFRDILYRVGNLRFAPPEPPLKFNGVRNASAYGAACAQQSKSLQVVPRLTLGILLPLPNISEDCESYPIRIFFPTFLQWRSAGLFINVIKPANIAIDKQLPVLFVRLCYSYFDIHVC